MPKKAAPKEPKPLNKMGRGVVSAKRLKKTAKGGGIPASVAVVEGYKYAQKRLAEREVKEKVKKETKRAETTERAAKRRDTNIGDYDKRIKWLEQNPSRIAVKQLRNFVNDPNCPPLQKTEASAILLSWSDGEFNGRRRHRREG